MKKKCIECDNDTSDYIDSDKCIDCYNRSLGYWDEDDKEYDKLLVHILRYLIAIAVVVLIGTIIYYALTDSSDAVVYMTGAIAIGVLIGLTIAGAIKLIINIKHQIDKYYG